MAITVAATAAVAGITWCAAKARDSADGSARCSAQASSKVNSTVYAATLAIKAHTLTSTGLLHAEPPHQGRQLRRHGVGQRQHREPRICGDEHEVIAAVGKLVTKQFTRR